MDEEKRRAADLKSAESLIARYGKILTFLVLGAVGYLRLSWTVEDLAKRSENWQKNADARRDDRNREETQEKLDIKELKTDMIWVKQLVLRGK